jgi:hypothetical protein
MPLKQHEADQLIDVIRRLVSTEHKIPSEEKLKAEIVGGRRGGKVDAQREAGKALTLDRHTVEGTGSAGDTVQAFDEPKLEELYQSFKNRLLEELPVDPVLLHLLSVRPEIIVDVERKVIELDGSTDLKGRIARLIAAGFLSQHRARGAIVNELKKTGTEPAGNRMSEAMDWLKRAGFLIFDDDEWIAAPGVKVTERSIEA